VKTHKISAESATFSKQLKLFLQCGYIIQLMESRSKKSMHDFHIQEQLKQQITNNTNAVYRSKMKD